MIGESDAEPLSRLTSTGNPPHPINSSDFQTREDEKKEVDRQIQRRDDWQLKTEKERMKHRAPTLFSNLFIFFELKQTARGSINNGEARQMKRRRSLFNFSWLQQYQDSVSHEWHMKTSLKINCGINYHQTRTHYSTSLSHSSLLRSVHRYAV